MVIASVRGGGGLFSADIEGKNPKPLSTKYMKSLWWCHNFINQKLCQELLTTREEEKWCHIFKIIFVSILNCNFVIFYVIRCN